MRFTLMRSGVYNHMTSHSSNSWSTSINTLTNVCALFINSKFQDLDHEASNGHVYNTSSITDGLMHCVVYVIDATAKDHRKMDDIANSLAEQYGSTSLV